MLHEDLFREGFDSLYRVFTPEGDAIKRKNEFLSDHKLNKKIYRSEPRYKRYVSMSAALLPWKVPGHPHELLLPVRTGKENFISYLLLQALPDRGGDYLLKESPHEKYFLHPVQVARLKSFRGNINREISRAARYLRKHGKVIPGPYDSNYNLTDLEARLGKDISLPKIFATFNNHNETPNILPTGRCDLTSLVPEKLLGNVMRECRLVQQDENFQNRTCVHIMKIIDGWKQHTKLKDQDLYLRLKAITNLVPEIPFMWAKEISESKKLSWWFQRYPDILFRLVCYSAFADSQHNTYKNVQTLAVKHLLVPHIFELIENDHTDDEILAKMDYPLNPEDITEVTQRTTKRRLTPAERRVAAKRTKDWHRKAAEAFRDFIDTRESGYAPTAFTHLGHGYYTSFVPKLAERYNVRTTAINYDNGELLEPHDFILRMITQTPSMKRSLTNSKFQPWILSRYANFDTEDDFTNFLVHDPENLYKALGKKNKYKEARTLCSEIGDCIGCLIENAIIPNIRYSHSGSNLYVHTNMTAAELVQVVTQFACELGFTITSAVKDTHLRKILSDNPDMNPPSWSSPHLQKFAPEGWTVTPLTTPSMLDSEALKMQHCIGGYTSRALDKKQHSHLYHVDILGSEPKSMEVIHKIRDHKWYIRVFLGFKNQAPPSEEWDHANRMLDAYIKARNHDQKYNQEALEHEIDSRDNARRTLKKMETAVTAQQVLMAQKAAQDIFFQRFPKLRKIQKYERVIDVPNP